MYVGQRFGPFTIEKELGSGAMGAVYRASLDRDGKQVQVALKVIALGLQGNDTAMARFTREAEILKQLKHPHIVRFIGAGKQGRTNPVHFIAMEFVEGESLDRVLARRTRLGWEEVVDYAKQLCSALQHAHDKGIIHRDLKPSNLMVTTGGKLKLTDFGIAKDTDVTALTGANSTIGTAAYMSPEQCRGEKHLSAKSDLYSLGVVLFELLTGRKPFVAETTVDMFMKHVQDTPPRPTKFIPDVPVWLDNLVMFLLEKDKSIRPMDAATVGKMLEDIETKMQNQQSAGVEAATARKADRRLNDATLDEQDKEAARSLKAAKTGKKLKKKKATPLLERQWVRAMPAILAVLGLLGGAYYLFKPAGQQSLADTVLKGDSPDAIIKAGEAYLAKYGSSTDELTQTVKKKVRETRGRQLERVLDNRFRNKRPLTENTDEQAFEAAWRAMEAEEKGELKRAADNWATVKAREPEIKDQYLEGWSWLVESRQQQIADVEKKIAAIRDSLRDMEVNEKPWKFDANDPESLAKYAIRLGIEGGALPVPSNDPDSKNAAPIKDEAKGRRILDDLAKLTKDKSDLRMWHLFAVSRRGANYDPKKDDSKVRQETLAKQLATIRIEWDRVTKLSDAGPAKRDCWNRCRELVECYEDESDDEIKKIVAEAKKLLGTMKA